MPVWLGSSASFYLLGAVTDCSSYQGASWPRRSSLSDHLATSSRHCIGPWSVRSDQVPASPTRVEVVAWSCFTIAASHSGSWSRGCLLVTIWSGSANTEVYLSRTWCPFSWCTLLGKSPCGPCSSGGAQREPAPSNKRMDLTTRGLCLARCIALSLAGLEWGCGGQSPTSPAQSPIGVWHGVSVAQTAGEVIGRFAREDITLGGDGTAAIAEYEGLMRSDVGTWSLAGSAISIDFPSFCDRRGSLTGTTMNLTCTLDTRTWALTFEKR